MVLRLRPFALFLAFFLAFFGAASRGFCEQAPEEEKPDPPRVEMVLIKGMGILPSPRIRNLLTVKPSWKPWVKKPAYDPAEIKQDARNIQNFLQNEGFFDAEVETTVTDRQGGRMKDITYTISEGRPTLVRAVDINGIEQVPERLSKRVLRVAGKLAGLRFSDTDYRDTKGKIAEILSEHGYPYCEVNGTVLVFRSEYAADVIFDVTTGNFVSFGPVAITGLQSTSPELIRSKLLFEEGEPYSQAKVYESQKDLFMMGPFAAIFIRPDQEDEKRIQDSPPEDGPFSLPLTISGVYRKPREVKLGLGYGTEDKVRGQVTWRNRNMGRYGQNMSVSAKASSLTQSLEARLAYPYFFSPKNEAEDVLGLAREDAVSYVNRSLYNKISLRRLLAGPYHITVGHNLELDSPEQLPPEDILADYLEDHRYLISTVAFSVERDTRHPVFDPVRGSLLSLSIAGSPSWIGSEIRYMQGGAEARFFQRITHRVVLAFRAEYEGIQPIENTDSIPVFKRLFCGGSNSVRGYSYQYLGPRDSQGKPLGGLTMYLASVELRFPIYKDLAGVLFSDSGAVLTDSFTFDTSAIRYTAGVGLRYQTPVGPIRIDVGHQLNPQDKTDTTTQFYFSIGQAF
ncbi:MAG: BamA/TamA family outer membrane protein [Thermodesulfobacteriota bacterium]